METIGDAYMAVTGVPKIQDDHAERMADFAMDMMEEAGNVLSPATGKPLKVGSSVYCKASVAVCAPQHNAALTASLQCPFTGTERHVTR